MAGQPVFAFSPAGDRRTCRAPSRARAGRRTHQPPSTSETCLPPPLSCRLAAFVSHLRAGTVAPAGIRCPFNSIFRRDAMEDCGLRRAPTKSSDEAQIVRRASSSRQSSASGGARGGFVPFPVAWPARGRFRPPSTSILPSRLVPAFTAVTSAANLHLAYCGRSSVRVAIRNCSWASSCCRPPWPGAPWASRSRNSWRQSPRPEGLGPRAASRAPVCEKSSEPS